VLGQIAQAPRELDTSFGGAWILAEQLDRAGARREVARQHFHGRRLARAVRPEEGGDSALADLEGEVSNGHEIAVDLRNRVRANGHRSRCGHACSFGWRLRRGRKTPARS